MKTYRGVRTSAGCRVTVNGIPLLMRLDLRHHSPTGFEWGYEGSGPAQLALAVLADHLEDDERAMTVYQEFKRDIVAHLAHEEWILTTEDIAQWWNRGDTNIGGRPVDAAPAPAPTKG